MPRKRTFKIHRHFHLSTGILPHLRCPGVSHMISPTGPAVCYVHHVAAQEDQLRYSRTKWPKDHSLRCERDLNQVRGSKSSLPLLDLLLVTIFTTGVATGKPQVPFQLWGSISSSVYVYFYHQYIQQPWDALLLDHQNTMMGNTFQIKHWGNNGV